MFIHVLSCYRKYNQFLYSEFLLTLLHILCNYVKLMYKFLVRGFFLADNLVNIPKQTFI